MTSAAAPQLSAPTSGRKPSRSAVAAAAGLAARSGSTKSRGAPLQQTKCSGVLPVFGSTSLAAPGFAWSVARNESLLIGPPLVKYSRRGDMVLQ